jgi:hypothetical protein
MQEKPKNFWDKTKITLKYIKEEYIKFPLYILAHPLKGFEIFKREKRAKTSVAITFIVILVLLNILSFQYSGFEVNDNEIKDLNSIAEITYIVGVIALITIANWAVTTLFDGKGTMKDIFLMVSYSLFPLIWATGIGIVLSRVLTGEELAIYGLIIATGGFMTAYMVFLGMISIHEYGLGKCLLTILFTIIAAAIIIFVFLLCFNLFQMMYGFLYTIYQEITLRSIF